ncbi:hypothetical protein [Alkalicoccus urumqiensis]|nr:hypothetical protein [Alkalicoccus urumqiensis]
MTLFRKEWRETRTVFFILQGVFTFLYLLIWFSLTQNSGWAFLLMFVVAAAHVLYLFIAWLWSLQGEWRSRTHWTWLNLPVPGWKLITSKLAAVFSQYLLSLAYAMAAGWFSLRLFLEQFPAVLPVDELDRSLLSFYESASPWIYLLMTHLSLQFGFAVVLLYLLFKAFRFLGAAAGVLLIIGWNYLTSAAEGVFQLLQFGEIVNLSELFYRTFSLPPGRMMADGTENLILYAGDTLFYLVFYAVLLAVFHYLIDRKIEA